jgi:hypothetical protein
MEIVTFNPIALLVLRPSRRHHKHPVENIASGQVLVAWQSKGSQTLVLFGSDHSEAFGKERLALCGRTPTEHRSDLKPCRIPNRRPSLSARWRSWKDSFTAQRELNVLPHVRQTRSHENPVPELNWGSFLRRNIYAGLLDLVRVLIRFVHIILAHSTCWASLVTNNNNTK